ncbi:siderophore-iron reductase FhuF [Glaciimonas sp. PAMC28666]|uniref:siderophore-iron reductase FhuF n=1 Tax=Glaciimonas sp. PAMC28666 TaxID=2807626 RepID=UPI001965C02C|nr:siderophore-iron reductase FhuF [Glaciimonas sp. PAMC28666]QRX81447.1 siderophore-iron reductase FhuF [Glaciimonas sp. PAMC28666]
MNAAFDDLVGATGGSNPAPTCLAKSVPIAFAPHCRSVWFGCHPVVKGTSMLVPANRLTEHLVLLINAMQQHYAGDDVRALISQWSKYYFSLIIPAAVVAARVLRRPLHMALEASMLVLRNGMPHTLWLPADALGVINDDPLVRYRSLCVEHLAPQIAAISAAAKIPARVLWSNVGNSLEYALSTLAVDDNTAPDIAFLFERQAFFDTSHPNPLYRAIRYVRPVSAQLPDPMRVRRICCLRNQLPGEQMLCSSCPLLLNLKAPLLAEQIQLMKQGDDA